MRNECVPSGTGLLDCLDAIVKKSFKKHNMQAMCDCTQTEKMGKED